MQLEPKPHQLETIVQCAEIQCSPSINHWDSPTETEALDIRRTIDKLNQDILNLQASTLPGHDHEIRRLLALQTKYASYLAPIRKLHPELLSEIFQQCGEVGPPMVPSIKTAPLLLTRVCKHWREVALSNPLLWKSLRIFVGRSVNSKVELTRMWLQRSGACPLNISFSAYTNFDARPVLDIVNSYSERWQYVDFDMPPALYHHLEPVSGTLPMLQALTVYINQPNDGGDSLAVFRSAYRLHTLSINWALYPFLGAFPYNQLTCLSVTCPAIADLGVIAQHCPGLVKWSIICEGLAEQDVSTSPPIVLERLRCLSLYMPNSTDYGAIFDLLTLPALEELQVEDPYYACPPWPLARFVSLLDRSMCSIKKLALLRVAIDDHQLTSLFELMSDLLEFRLQERKNGPWPSLTNGILMKLTNRQGTPYLIPKLQVLAIERRFTLNISMFIDMVRSRWNPPKDQPHILPTRNHTLVAVRFTPVGRKEKYKWALEGLLALQAEGMTIIVPPRWQ